MGSLCLSVSTTYSSSSHAPSHGDSAYVDILIHTSRLTPRPLSHRLFSHPCLRYSSVTTPLANSPHHFAPRSPAPNPQRRLRKGGRGRGWGGGCTPTVPLAVTPSPPPLPQVQVTLTRGERDRCYTQVRVIMGHLRRHCMGLLHVRLFSVRRETVGH